MEVDRTLLGVGPALELVVTCRREVRAGIERIWENVFDWEHLPVLHDMYFDKVELLEIGTEGWRVALTKQPGTPDRRMILELKADRKKHRYRVKITAGDGAGSEIWTMMTPLGPQRTAIEVQYYLPERHAEKRKELAEKYRRSCEQLWDQDEAMMIRREAMVARATAPTLPSPASGGGSGRGSSTPVSLGLLAGLRQRLPLLVEFDGEEFRIVELEDESLIAHSTTCPHWLGPLAEAVPKKGVLRCPWMVTVLTCVPATAPTGVVTNWHRRRRWRSIQ